MNNLEELPERGELLASTQPLWRRRRLIGAGPVVGALIALSISAVMPRQYTATATVFVVPPTYAGDLRPAPLTPDGYSRTAESDHVVQTVRQEASKRAGTPFTGRLVSKLYASGDPEKPYLPLIGLTAVAPTPQQAQIAAQAWAETLVQLQSTLDRERTEPTAALMISELKPRDKALQEAEQAARAAESEYDTNVAKVDQQVGVPQMTNRIRILEAMAEDLRSELQRMEARSKDAAERIAKLLAPLSNASSSTAGSRDSNTVVMALLRDVVADARSRQKTLDEQITAIERRLLDVGTELGRLRAERTGAAERRNEIVKYEKARVDVLKERAQALNAAVTKITARAVDVKVAEQSPPALKAAAAALPPSRRSSPTFVFNILLGTVAGLFLAIAYAWITGDASPSF